MRQANASSPPGSSGGERLRIVLAHNRYQQRGGEDQVFNNERELLAAAGHELALFERSNESIESSSSLDKLSLAAGTIWSRRSARELTTLLREFKPQLVHFTNSFPLISPAAYYACQKAGVPVVQSLHNYRLLCPAATLSRAGGVCEDCLGRSVAWPAVRHACYRSSRAASAVVAGMLAIHRQLGTWNRRVDRYIALTEFARRKLIAGGLPAEKICVKANFLTTDPGVGRSGGDYALFVGRLTLEKGLLNLLDCWRELADIPLKIAGTGPLAGQLAERVSREGQAGVELLGWCQPDRVAKLMRDARLLVVPSQWYEGFPVTLLEAFARGLPVIASRIGSLEELVTDGRTGLLAEPANPLELADRVRRLWHDPKLAAELAAQARAVFEQRYTAESNYRQLMTIYAGVLGRAGAPR